MTDNTCQIQYGTKRLLSYLQSTYSQRFQWVTPLPWKSNVKYLFDQIYMKDVRFSQDVYYDNIILLRSCTPQVIGNDFMSNLFNGLEQLDIRLVTIQGRVGSGKSMFVQRLMRDWLRSLKSCKSNKNENVKYFLHCHLSDATLRENTRPLSLEDVTSLFHIPDYLYDEFVDLIENHGENIVLLAEVDDLHASSRFLFKLFHKVFPASKFLVFTRSTVSDRVKAFLQPQELQYLMRRRINIQLHDFETKQIFSLMKLTSSNTLMYQNFRDMLHENKELKRLCKNPFICMAVISLYKEAKSTKLLENRVVFFRKILLNLWKRHSKWHDNLSDTDITCHIDSMLTGFTQEAIDSYTNDGFFTEQDVLQNEHSSLLIETGLLEEHSNSDATIESCFYTFFDPLLYEYTCALFYYKLVIERPDEIVTISSMLFSTQYRNICIFLAGLLGRDFSFFLEEVNFEMCDEEGWMIFSECLHQCQCPSLVMRHVRKFEFPCSLDFSAFILTSSTFKGLQFLAGWLQSDSSSPENNSANTRHSAYENKRSSLNLEYRKSAIERYFNTLSPKSEGAIPPTKKGEIGIDKQLKYNSCPDLNQAFTKLTITFNDIDNGIAGQDNGEEDLSWGGHYKAHLSKQSSLASLNCTVNEQSKNLNRSPSANNVFFNINPQQWLTPSLDPFSRSQSSFSLYSSLDMLASPKKENTLKELKLKGSTIGNRAFSSLVTFLKANQLEGLFLMDQSDGSNQRHVVSSKLVGKFFEAVMTSNLNELTLNSNHLGSNWMTKLTELIESESELKFIGVSVLSLEDLTVENAIKLGKSMKYNKTIEQVELYCGVQPIVVQASLSFFVDLLEKDDRLSLTFL